MGRPTCSELSEDDWDLLMEEEDLQALVESTGQDALELRIHFSPDST